MVMSSNWGALSMCLKISFLMRSINSEADEAGFSRSAKNRFFEKNSCWEDSASVTPSVYPIKVSPGSMVTLPMEQD